MMLAMHSCTAAEATPHKEIGEGRALFLLLLSLSTPPAPLATALLFSPPPPLSTRFKPNDALGATPDHLVPLLRDFIHGILRLLYAVPPGIRNSRVASFLDGTYLHLKRDDSSSALRPLLFHPQGRPSGACKSEGNCNAAAARREVETSEVVGR